METKKCKECGRELPVTEFMMTRWGNYTDVCKGCIKDKKDETRSNKRIGGVNRMPLVRTTLTQILMASNPWRCCS